MREFISGLPSKLPKVDLNKQEQEISDWIANGGKVTHLSDTQHLPRPAHRVEKPDGVAMQKAIAVVNRIQTSGLTYKGFVSILGNKVNPAHIRQIIKNHMGLNLVYVIHYTQCNKAVVKMGLKK